MRGVLAIKTWTFTLLILSGANAAICQESRLFPDVVLGSGWQIPVHAKVPSHERHITDPSHHLEISLQDYAVAKVFDVPRYYMDDQKLIVATNTVHTALLTSYSVNGQVFAYSAIVFGVGAAINGQVWWIDRLGSGRYDEFLWSRVTPSPPEWILNKESHASRSSGSTFRNGTGG